MAGRDGTDGNARSRNATVRRRRVTILAGAVGACAAAAAMATGSAVTAAPAKADIDDLLDPIIQPLLTSVTEAISGFDPGAAADLTSWTDSLLGSLNSIDFALPSAAEPAAAVAAASDPTSGTYDIPITLAEDTEPTVRATVDGASNTLLVDTGSSGLVLPWEDLGSNDFQALWNFLELGFPTGINESGYSGGVDYIYLTFNDVSVDYGNGALDTTNTPIDVEILSWPTSLSSPGSFQGFLADDDVTGILGIGGNTAGPTESPFEAEGFNGVLVDIPQNELVVGSNTAAGANDITVSGAPIANLYESVNGGPSVAVSDDIDSGGVFGTIPSSLESGSSVPSGTLITVTDSRGDVLYSYTTGNLGGSGYDGPTPVSGNDIDSGVLPFLQEPIYISYTDETLTFDSP